MHDTTRQIQARRLLGRGLCAGLVATVAGLALGACKCGKDAVREGDGAARIETEAPPTALQSEIAVRNPARLTDDLLALARRFVQLPVDREVVVGLVLQRARLPRGLADALALDKTIWLLGLDEEQLKTKGTTPSVMALPIRSKQALQSALAVKMKLAGEDGELSIYAPKESFPTLTGLKLWIGETHAVIASSREAFDAVKGYLRDRLLPREPKSDVVARIVRHDVSAAQVQHTLQKLQDTVKRSTGSTGNPQLESAISSILLRYSELLTTSPRLELRADLEGTDVALSARAESAPRSDLARAIKRQKTGPPFAAEFVPAATWGLFAQHDFPGKKGSSLLGGFLHQVSTFFPAHRREELTKTLSAAAEHFGNSLTVALHRPAEGGLGVLLLSHVTNRGEAEKSVAAIASLVSDWAREEHTAGRATAELAQEEVACGEAKGGVYYVPLGKEPDPSNPASLLNRLIGERFGIGWAFARNIGVFALGRGVTKQLQRSCDQILKEQSTPFAKGAPFKRAVGDPSTRSGLAYLSLVDLVRGLGDLRMPELQPLIAAARDAKAEQAISADWGVDPARQAFTLNLKLPLGELLHFKPFLSNLGPTGAPATPPVTPGPR